MKIMFINNDGAGFADYIEIQHGTTVAGFFETKMHQAKPQNYLIRVDGKPATREQALVEGSRVSITPTKIEGALTGSFKLLAA